MPDELHSFYLELLSNDGRSNIGLLSLLVACHHSLKKLKYLD